MFRARFGTCDLARLSELVNRCEGVCGQLAVTWTSLPTASLFLKIFAHLTLLQGKLERLRWAWSWVPGPAASCVLRGELPPPPSLDPVLVLTNGGADANLGVPARVKERHTCVPSLGCTVTVTWSTRCISPPLTFSRGLTRQIKQTEIFVKESCVWPLAGPPAV